MTNQLPLTNQFLVATTIDHDSDYMHLVVYVCEHHEHGTIGLIINRPTPYSYDLIFEQMNLKPVNKQVGSRPLLFGGPVQQERGFVIHRPFGKWRSSLFLNDDVTITTSNDIIQSIAAGDGPQDVLIALGFIGWPNNQLEQEVIENAWLVCPFSANILYETPFQERWLQAGQTMGIDMMRLVAGSGHA